MREAFGDSRLDDGHHRQPRPGLRVAAHWMSAHSSTWQSVTDAVLYSRPGFEIVGARSRDTGRRAAVARGVDRSGAARLPSTRRPPGFAHSERSRTRSVSTRIRPRRKRSRPCWCERASRRRIAICCRCCCLVCPEPLRSLGGVAGACATLDGVFPKTRYPDTPIPTSAEVDAAVSAARLIREAARIVGVAVERRSPERCTRSSAPVRVSLGVVRRQPPGASMATAKTATKTTKQRRKGSRRAGVARPRRAQARQHRPAGAVETLGRTIEDDGGVRARQVSRSARRHTGSCSPRCRSTSVEPTPYQRDLSEAHVARVANAIDKLDRYLDPVIAVPAGDGKYWSPNGYHRLGAMRELGAKSIVALVVPEPEVAHRILLLNTEKAHNLRETRARGGASRREPGGARRSAGARVRDRVRGGGARHARAVLPAKRPLLRRRVSSGAQALRQVPRLPSCPAALATRRERAAKLLELNELVNEAVKSMKARGLESPYLKAFVVARINPLRFQRKPTADFDETIDKMIGSARRFDAAQDQGGSDRAHAAAHRRIGGVARDARAIASAVVHRSLRRRGDVAASRRAGRRAQAAGEARRRDPVRVRRQQGAKTRIRARAGAGVRRRHARHARRRAVESRARDGRGRRKARAASVC